MFHPSRLCALTATLLLGLAASFVQPARAADDAGGPVNPADYKDPVKVACVGDSITYGAGIKNRDRDSYPSVLGRLLGDKWAVRNFGVSGATLLHNGDKPYDKQKAYNEALVFKPDVLIVKLGTNDSKPQNWKHKDEFAADYKALVDAFKKVNPKVRVYAALPVPAFPGNFGITDEVIKGEVIPLERQAAKDTGATVVDLYEALSGKKELFPDKVHPNEQGAALMAATVYHALTGKDAPAPLPAGGAGEKAGATR